MRAISTRNDDPTRASRPFDRGARRFRPRARARGILVLEEYEHARARGAKIYCEVLGYGQSADAYDLVARRSRRQRRACSRFARAFAKRRHRADRRRLHQRARHLDARSAIRPNRRRSKKPSASTPTRSASARPSRMHGHALGAAGGIEGVATVLAVAERHHAADDQLRVPRSRMPARLRSQRRAQGARFASRCRTRSASAATTASLVFGKVRSGELRWRAKHTGGVCAPLLRLRRAVAPAIIAGRAGLRARELRARARRRIERAHGVSRRLGARLVIAQLALRALRGRSRRDAHAAQGRDRQRRAARADRAPARSSARCCSWARGCAPPAAPTIRRCWPTRSKRSSARSILRYGTGEARARSCVRRARRASSIIRPATRCSTQRRGLQHYTPGASRRRRRSIAKTQPRHAAASGLRCRASRVEGQDPRHAGKRSVRRKRAQQSRGAGSAALPSASRAARRERAHEATRSPAFGFKTFAEPTSLDFGERHHRDRRAERLGQIELRRRVPLGARRDVQQAVCAVAEARRRHLRRQRQAQAARAGRSVGARSTTPTGKLPSRILGSRDHAPRLPRGRERVLHQPQPRAACATSSIC